MFHPMWVIKNLLYHSFITSIEHTSFVSVLKNIDACKSTNATSLLTQTKMSRLLGSELDLIVLYCTWELEARIQYQRSHSRQ